MRLPGDDDPFGKNLRQAGGQAAQGGQFALRSRVIAQPRIGKAKV